MLPLRGGGGRAQSCTRPHSGSPIPRQGAVSRLHSAISPAPFAYLGPWPAAFQIISVIYGPHRRSRGGAPPEGNCGSQALGWGEVQKGSLGFNLRPVLGEVQKAPKPSLPRPTPATPKPACPTSWSPAEHPIPAHPLDFSIYIPQSLQKEAYCPKHSWGSGFSQKGVPAAQCTDWEQADKQKHPGFSPGALGLPALPAQTHKFEFTKSFPPRLGEQEQGFRDIVWPHSWPL